MTSRDSTCPYCRRRRMLDAIHPTGGGAVARFKYLPCSCERTRRETVSRMANQHLAAFAVLPTVITGIAGLIFQSDALLVLGALGAIASAAVWLWNRPKR